MRLTRVEPFVDELYQQPLLEIEWAAEDALAFPFCISTVGPPPKCERIEKVSVARGNILLVDHGRRVPAESLGAVPVAATTVVCEGVGRASEVRVLAGPFRPVLANGAITHSQPLPAAGPAVALLIQNPDQAIPWVKLHSEPAVVRPQPAALSAPPSGPVEGETAGEEDGNGDGDGEETPLPPPIVAHTDPVTEWVARRDLLASAGNEPHFVVEIDNAGQAHLRFGDGELGRAPAAGERFTACYRVGNGLAGNVGPESILHVVSSETVSGVQLRPRNPLPATGGVDPEPISEVKLFAPHAFRRTLQRAIIPEDYAAIVLRDFAGKVQRAAAVLRWTGSWYEVLVAIDPVGQTTAAAGLLAAIELHLHRYRRIGHDVVVKLAVYVPLEIELEVCVRPAFLRGHIKAALQERFSNRTLPNGQLGFFHPDRLTFGEGIYLSEIVAATQAVPGVESVVVKKLERRFEGPNGEIDKGLLPLGPLEIARLDSDPDFPENGKLTLTLRGGR